MMSGQQLSPPPIPQLVGQIGRPDDVGKEQGGE
jgi:hypothetical protein